MMDGGYPGSKYSEDMFISPGSQCGSNISVSHEPQDYKVTLLLTKIFDRLMVYVCSIWAEVSARVTRATEDTTATQQVSPQVLAFNDFI